MSDIRHPLQRRSFPSNMNVKSRASHEHLKYIWRINRNSLKVLCCRTVHARTAERRGAASLSKEMTMTILNSNSNYAATPPAIRRVFGIFLARLARLINRWIAAVIAHREYQANLVVLRSFSDRELKDIASIGVGSAKPWQTPPRLDCGSSNPGGADATSAIGD